MLQKNLLLGHQVRMLLKCFVYSTVAGVIGCISLPVSGCIFCVARYPTPSLNHHQSYDDLYILVPFFSSGLGQDDCGISLVILRFIYIILSPFSSKHFLLQSVVGDPLLLTMVPLIHIKTQLREPRYSSDVAQGLSQLGG